MNRELSRRDVLQAGVTGIAAGLAAPAPWRPAWCHGTRTRRRRGGRKGALEFLSAKNAISLVELARKRLWRVDVLYARGTVQLASLAETGETLPNGRPKREWTGPPVVKDITAIQLMSPGQSLYAAIWHDNKFVFACEGPFRKITLTRLREVINGDQQL